MPDRYALGHVFHSMAACVDKISRGRRELARRFVPLENAPSLFKSKPTHSSIFGGTSTQSQKRGQRGRGSKGKKRQAGAAAYQRY